MALTFTCARVGSLNYIKYLVDAPSLSDRVNEPKLLDFTLDSGDDGAYVQLRRGDRVVLHTDTYGDWFTGYITNNPEPAFVGRSHTGNPIFRYKFNATSDEIILNMQPIGLLPPYINTTQGGIIKDLISRLDVNSVFDTSGVQVGENIAYLEIDPQKKFWDVVKDIADSSFYRFYVKNYHAYFEPADATSAGIIIDGNDKHFTPSALSLTNNQEPLANDVLVTGLVEPQGYVSEYFVGDGFTASYPLLAGVYGIAKSVILTDDFSGTQVDTSKWTVIGDPTATFIQPFSGYLNVVGGNNAGATDVYIQSILPIPLEGHMRLTHGEFDFPAASEGIIGGLWTGTPNVSLTGCVFGLKCAKSGTDTTITPVAGGTADGAQTYTIDNTKRYVIRTIASFNNTNRFSNFYSYINSGGTVGGYGGTGLADTVTFTTYITVVDPTTGEVVSTVIMTSADVALTDTQLTAYYIPAASVDLHIAFTAVTLSIPVECKLEEQENVNDGFDPTAAGWTTKLVGPNDLDAQDGLSPVATIVEAEGNNNSNKTDVVRYNPGLATLEFFKNSSALTSTTPSPFTLLHLKYRRAGAAMARVKDTTSIASEATAWGDDGHRSLVKTDLNPLPRNSKECELAAGAIIKDVNYKHFDGNYKHYSNTSFTSEPTSGTIIQFSNLDSGAYSGVFPNLAFEWVTDVTTTLVSKTPSELFEHTITFGRASKYIRETSLLGDPYSKAQGYTVPQDSIDQPKYIDIANVGTSFTDDVLAPILSGYDSLAFTFDVSQTFPSGGGFEVRYTDNGWGPADGKNLVTRITSGSTFSVVRNRRNQTLFIRAYDASGNMSRDSSALRVSFPFIPQEVQNLSGVKVDDTTLRFEYDLPTGDALGDIYKVQMEDQFGSILGQFTPDYTTTHQVVLLPIPASFNIATGGQIFVKTYNVLGESSSNLMALAASGVVVSNPVVTIGGTNDTDDGMIHVREYGAVGDGVTDDTAAIQAALNAAGGSVAVGSGTSDLTLTVIVSGKTMPWLRIPNPTLLYSSNNGESPVVIRHTVIQGQTINVSATGTVRCSGARPFVGPNGQADYPTGDLIGDNGTYFPTHYVTSSTMGLGGLMAVFTDAFGQVVQIVEAGASATLTVPVGATLLQFGIDDDDFHDNLGSFTVTVVIHGQSNGVGLRARDRKIVFVPSDMLCAVSSGFPSLGGTHIGPYTGNTQTSGSTWNPTTKKLIWVSDVTGTDGTDVQFKVISNNGTPTTINANGLTTNSNSGPAIAFIFQDSSYIYLGHGSGYGGGGWHKINFSGTEVGWVGGIGALSSYRYPYFANLGMVDGAQCIVASTIFGDLILYDTAGTMSEINGVGSIGNGPVVFDGSSNAWIAIGSSILKIDWNTGPTTTTYAIGMSGTPQSILFDVADDTVIVSTDTHLYKISCGTGTVVGSTTRTYAGMSSEIALDGTFICGMDRVNASTLATIQADNISNYSLPHGVNTGVFHIPFDSDMGIVWVQDTTNHDVYGLISSLADGTACLSMPSNVDFLIDGTLQAKQPLYGCGYMIKCDTVSNVRIRGRGTLDANNAVYLGVLCGQGVLFNACTNYKLQDITIINVNKSSATKVSASSRGTIHDVLLIGGSEAEGITINTADQLMLESCMIRGFNKGVVHDTLTESIIHGNIFKSCTTEFYPDTFDNTVVVHSQLINGAADRRYIREVTVNGTDNGDAVHFSDTTPLPPGTSLNVAWARDSSGNVSASLDIPPPANKYTVRRLTAVVSSSSVSGGVVTGIIGTGIQVDFSGTIIGWSIELDQADTIAIAVSKKSSSAPPAAPSVPNTTTDKISASAPIATSSAQTAAVDSSGVSTWTTSVAQWDTFLFNITSVGGVCGRVTAVLLIQQN